MGELNSHGRPQTGRPHTGAQRVCVVYVFEILYRLCASFHGPKCSRAGGREVRRSGTQFLALESSRFLLPKPVTACTALITFTAMRETQLSTRSSHRFLS